MKTTFSLRSAGFRQSLRGPRRPIVLLLALLSLLAGPRAGAQTTPTFPAGFSASLVVNGLTNPTALAFAPDGRIFLAEQAGKLRVVKNGALLPTPFVSLAVDSNGERGLDGVTVDPDFMTNHYVYLYYTLASGANNRIVRYTATSDVADLSTEKVILDLDPLSTATNHNGGAMHFGRDGKLYVAVGENANGINAQNLDSYMGKLLRINADGSVPAGNPYAGSGLSAQRQRIWSYGLRNPFTFSVQPGTGRIFVNNVGNGSWEEIDEASASGLNFGWPNDEGYVVKAGETAPLFAYSHNSSLPVNQYGCAITGGTFFNPASTNYPAQYVGKYFYQDLCNNWINYIDPASSSPAPFQGFATNLPSQSLGLETGPDGNLYYLSRYPAVALYKIVYTATSSAPVITTQPQSASVPPGMAATFAVAATGTAPLSYQWQKNSVNIAGATASSYPIASAVAADAGQYRAVVTNPVGSTTSSAATLTITAPNTAPTAQILTPAAGATYVAGTTLTFSGDATDPEDGALPASAYVWQLDLHHADHVHDGTPFNQGSKTGSFTIPSSGETADNVFYRLLLTVTDAGGLKTTTYRDILPRKTTFTLATSPAGLSLTLDGTPQATPLATVGVEGITRTLGAPSPQTVGGVSYQFVSWSNGGAQTQTIVTPTEDVTYTATFKAVPAAPGPAVTSLTLINADTDQPLAGYDPLPSGATLNLATLPTRNLNIRANTNPATVGSVRFAYDGNANYKLENIAPYAIGGDNGTVNGGPNYNAWTPAVGSHTLTVTPYSAGGGGGTAGTATTVAFTVTTDTGPSLRTPENPASPSPGLDYAYYEGSWGALPAFAGLTPVKTGTSATFDLAPRLRDDNFGFRYTGYVSVPTDGVYTFYTSSDDGSRLAIGSTVVVDNDGLHGTQEKSGQLGLKAGLHAITVTFFEAGGDQVLSVSYAGPGLGKQVIPASALFRAPAARLAAGSTPAQGRETVQVYPNPARGQVTVRLQAAFGEQVELAVLDALARRVAGTTHRAATAGWNSVVLPLGPLPAGVYTLTVQHGGARTSRRLVVAP